MKLLSNIFILLVVFWHWGVLKVIDIILGSGCLMLDQI